MNLNLVNQKILPIYFFELESGHVGRECSVGTATGYGVGALGIESR